MNTAEIFRQLDSIEREISAAGDNSQGPAEAWEWPIERLRAALQNLTEIVRELVRRDNER